MSDNEYEKFEVTDYDLDNEFNINRPRRTLTKHQQIYGIWADDSDNDSEDEGKGRRGRRVRSDRKSKDYTAPVSFVAGGVQQAGKKKKNQEKEAEINDDNITDEEDERPSFGRKPQLLQNSNSANSSDSSSAEETAAPMPGRQQSSFQQQSADLPNAKNMGAWQKHTRGIGAKLLMQMGYKPGKGLGKDLQGISQPVEAHVRKGRGAIGAYGPETPASVGGKAANFKPDIVEGRKEIKDFNDKSGKWKKNSENRHEKVKRYYYKSVEEIIEKGQKNTTILSNKSSKKLSNVPVIDMTGPEKRVLSGYHAIGLTKMQDEDLYESVADTEAKKTVNFAVPELMHNIQLVVDMCEQEIISIDNTEREASEKKEAMAYELMNLEKIVVLEQNHISTLNKALKLVEELINGGTTLSLERAEKLFIELQHDYAAEYVEFHLADLAAGIIAPLVKSTLEEWQPLKQPTKYLDIIKRWRAILDPDNSTNINTAADSSRNVFDPYSSVIWAGVIPSFRACANEWNPKQHQPMAALLDSWAPLFPNWILDSVLEQLVLSRISSGVREWDPLTDTVPIHIWILPWNSILSKKMEEFVFPTIREKLGSALQAWMPQDRSARAMLSPWKGAFDEAEMQIFLLQHILPKLQLILNEFIINPLQQDLELWNQVWEWHEVIPTMLMAQLLDKYFFNKWMQVLALWLNQAPDFTEISRWYRGWKGMFSEELLREPCIKEHFRRALEMMHRATENLAAVNAGSYTGMPTGVNNTPPLGAEASQVPPSTALPSAYLDMQMSAPAQLEFKELVSQKCADRGILFAPLPGRREMGKQIYRVGKLYCYIDRNVCMISDSSVQNWAPTSLAQLLDRASIGLI